MCILCTRASSVGFSFSTSTAGAEKSDPSPIRGRSADDPRTIRTRSGHDPRNRYKWFFSPRARSLQKL